MKVSREQASQNRERVVQVASQLFRERGFDGIGVADLMKSAGLTHGGFYGHFASKEELMAEVCGVAFSNAVQLWTECAANAETHPLEAVTKAYLSQWHRDNPGAGCALASLGADSTRHGETVRQAMSRGVQSLLALFTSLAPGRSKAIKRERAIIAYASMVGALVMARAVDDEALSDEILETVAKTRTEAGA